MNQEPSAWALGRARGALIAAGCSPIGISQGTASAVALALDAAREEGRASSPLSRLEKWSHGHKARTVTIYSPDSYGAGCWEVTLGHEKGVTVADEANFWTWPDEKGGEAAYRAEAERQGCVFAECPEDTDWAGLDATIEAALAAFDRGVWGPEQVFLGGGATALATVRDVIRAIDTNNLEKP